MGIGYCRRCYRNREYPYELYDALVDRGWVGLTVPESHGGAGGSQLEQMILLEALGTYGYDFGIPIVTSTTVVENVLAEGTDAQVDQYVPSLLGGEIRFTVGVTEPVTGSDAASLQTRAVRDGDEYIVCGEKPTSQVQKRQMRSSKLTSGRIPMRRIEQAYRQFLFRQT